MILKFTHNLPPFMNDVPEVIRAFFPYIELSDDAAEVIDMHVECECLAPQSVSVSLTYGGNTETKKSAIFAETELEYKKLAKRFAKVELYAFCVKLTGARLPYGCLTGVRPTRLYYERFGSYCDKNNAEFAKYMNGFDVSPERIALVERVVKNQVDIYDYDPLGVDVFVNIPLCPTRCKYCSFISTEIGRVRKLVPKYIEAVKRELTAIRAETESKGYRVRSVYYGGGTPTALEADELAELLALTQYGTETTVEAGRPDSITAEKLDILAKYGVTRISINPQTFKDETLLLLGRAHTTAQLYSAFELAKPYGFDVNMDLIAGLPQETAEDFKNSLTRAIELNPANITVHTLAIKRGSALRNEGVVKSVSGLVKEMSDFSREALFGAGYEPYYMYRQKNMADNLENVGYCLPGKQCVYNVDYMEETNSILSAGAGAVGKTVDRANKLITRTSNAKGFEEYLRRAEID